MVFIAGLLASILIIVILIPIAFVIVYLIDFIVNDFEVYNVFGFLSRFFKNGRNQ